jgi:hypothetical protein
LCLSQENKLSNSEADRPTFLMPVDIPKYCFLSEAIEWIAFGRVPLANWIEERRNGNHVDYRFDWREMPDNFDHNFYYQWFEREEFVSLNVPVREEYFEAAEKCSEVDVHRLAKQISEYEAEPPKFVKDDQGQLFDLWKSLADDNRIQLNELGPLQTLVDEVEKEFAVFEELAWARLFPLVHSGAITLEGLDFGRWEKLSGDGEDEKAGEFSQISNAAFRIGHDWSADKVNIGDVDYIAVRINTDDILKHGASLLNEGKPISARSFGQFHLVNDVHAVPPSRRGRRSSVDWSAMKDELERMASSGGLPDSKEACIYHLIAFGEKRWRKTVSRTAVQRQLGSHLDEHFPRYRS